MKMLVKYHRDKHSRPIGVLVAINIGESFRIGWSLCCKKDVFNKKRAKEIAIGRAQYYTIEDVEKSCPQTLRKAFAEMCKRACKYYKTAT